ncbi:MAG: response regulator [Burkholderiales bacterium]|nr:response regulator [Burkholderiales bacterium]
MSAWAGCAALAADDDEASRKLAALMLKREGLVVTAVEDGQQALDHVAANHVDLVLMDLEMPRLGGLDAIRAIRALAPPRPARIVALTSHADETVRARCREAGADAYLVKPVRLADLQRVLGEVFAAPA